MTSRHTFLRPTAWTERFAVYDMACAAISPWLALIISGTGSPTGGEVSWVWYAVIALFVTLALLAYYRVGLDLWRYFSVTDLGQIAKASFGSAVLTIAIARTVVPLEKVPVLVAANHFFILFFLLISGRGFHQLLQRQSMQRDQQPPSGPENVVLIGTDDVAWFYIRAVRTMANARHKIVAVLDIDGTQVGRTLSGQPIVGHYAEASALLDEMAVHGIRVDRFVVSPSAAAPGSVYWTKLAQICNDRVINLDFLPERLNLCAIGVFTLDNHQTPWSGFFAPDEGIRYWRFKRVLDIGAALLGIVLLWPLFILVAAIVMTSCGLPIVFWQERLGRYARPVRIHKFRTLLGPLDTDGQRRSDTERATAAGRFLRATRLDELPQLYDILRGDMSLIGPRPLLPIDQPQDARLRLSVRPGLTGWAQVRGGRIISPEEKNALDIWYIRNASFLLDVRILLLSAKAVVLGDSRDEVALEHALPQGPEGGGVSKLS